MNTVLILERKCIVPNILAKRVQFMLIKWAFLPLLTSWFLSPPSPIRFCQIYFTYPLRQSSVIPSGNNDGCLGYFFTMFVSNTNLFQHAPIFYVISSTNHLLYKVMQWTIVAVWHYWDTAGHQLALAFWVIKDGRLTGRQTSCVTLSNGGGTVLHMFRVSSGNSQYPTWSHLWHDSPLP